MRKLLLLLIIFTLLAGCSVIPSTKPTMTSEEMATRVALLLTSMPTATAGVEEIPLEEIDLLEPTLSSDEDEVVELTETEEPLLEIGDIATPTTDETAFAEFLGETVTEEPTATEETVATATPPILMPTETPTPTLTPSITPGGTPVPQFQITATFTANDPRTLLPVASWTDTMDAGSNWPIGPDMYTTVDFTNGFMALTGLQKDNGWRLAINDVDNAYFETTAQFGPVCQGMDKWGMMLRSPDRSTADRGYWFNITCDGKFAFQRWNANPPDGQTAVTNLLAWTSNANIRPGANSVNRIGVLAKENQFTLFINGIQVGQVEDDTFASGGFGILIGARETNRFMIYVDEMSYWLNPPL